MKSFGSVNTIHLLTEGSLIKLEKLTAYQEALIPKVRDYWINLALHSGKQVQKEDSRRKGN